MITCIPLSTGPIKENGLMVLIPFTIDPSQPFADQTIANGTPVVRPSDGCQWTVVDSSPFPQWNDRICIVVSLVTAPTKPKQVITMRDTINIGS